MSVSSVSWESPRLIVPFETARQDAYCGAADRASLRAGLRVRKIDAAGGHKPISSDSKRLTATKAGQKD
jgi:hypothetical protein